MGRSHSTLPLWWPQHLPLPLAHPTWSSPTPPCWTRSLHSPRQSLAPKLTGGAAAVVTSPRIPWTLQLCWRCNPLSLLPLLYPAALGNTPPRDQRPAQWHSSTREARTRRGNDVAPGTSWGRKNQNKTKPYRGGVGEKVALLGCKCLNYMERRKKNTLIHSLVWAEMSFSKSLR